MLSNEAEYYGISRLVSLLKEENFPDLTRKDVILMSRETKLIGVVRLSCFHFGR